jgi:hypothetical protein
LLVADRVGVACTEIVAVATAVQPAVVVTVTEALTVPALFGVKVAGFAVFDVRLPDDTAQLAIETLLPATLAVRVKLLVDILQMVVCEGVMIAVVGVTVITVALLTVRPWQTPDVTEAVTLTVPELAKVTEFKTGFWIVEEKLGPLQV